MSRSAYERILGGMKVHDAMTRAPMIAPPNATIAAVAEAMDRASVGAVVVVDGSRPVGIITDHDLVVRALAQRLPFDHAGRR